jgi:hypothetical protein
MAWGVNIYTHWAFQILYKTRPDTYLTSNKYYENIGEEDDSTGREKIRPHSPGGQDPGILGTNKGV